jgi:hypothetical protein
MFTWICPTCGKELDLSAKECPECRDREAAGRDPGEDVPAGQASPASERASGFRFWVLLGVATVMGIAAAVWVAGHGITPRSGGPSRSAGSQEPARSKAPLSLEPVPETAPPAPLASGEVEVAGIRMFYDPQGRPQVRAVIINHGDQAIQNADLTVSLRAAQSGADAPPLARFAVKLSSLKPGESREVRSALEAFGTIASMPPWQKLRVDVEMR